MDHVAAITDVTSIQSTAQAIEKIERVLQTDASRDGLIRNEAGLVDSQRIDQFVGVGDLFAGKRIPSLRETLGQVGTGSSTLTEGVISTLRVAQGPSAELLSYGA